jgi:hypothetical protein
LLAFGNTAGAEYRTSACSDWLLQPGCHKDHAMILFLPSRCRKFDTLFLRRATLFVALSIPIGVSSVAIASNKDIAVTTVDRLIDEAGQSKSDGNAAMAYALLREAVRVAPDNSLVRWQLGQVKVGDEWLSIEEAQRRAAADPRQVKYGQRKAVMGESPQGQLALARWCTKNDLDDEARFHWTSVLSVDTANKEALRATGLHWRDGQLMTRDQIKESKQDLVETKQASRHWTTSVAAWMRALSDKDKTASTKVVDEIRAVSDAAAIPAFEKVTLNSELSPSEKNPAPQRLSLAFLGALRDMKLEEGTKSLVRHAVLSAFPDVRTEATAELRYRPLNDYVPMLLDGLAAPIQSAYRVVNDPDGSVHYLHSIYQEGPFVDRLHRTTHSIYQPGAGLGSAASLLMNAGSPPQIMPAINSNSRSEMVSAAAARRSARQYEQEITAAEEQIAQTNQSTAAMNERIYFVLTGATEQKLGSDPRPWWSWWQDYTDYYRTVDRPVYETQDSSNQYIRLPVQSASVECFARGTPVWTKTGQRPIESLTIGDLVLSQNINTGEINYKPVMGRTLRPVGPIVEISTAGEKILSTRGHPLWVAGAGWRMAKELENGAVLNSLTGDARIAAVRPATNAETYNLVVADFNTYFVGESGMLVHDNTPCTPTQAILPGVLQK